MTTTPTPSKAMNISLWIVQGLLSLSLLWAGSTKLFTDPAALSAMWPWTAENRELVAITGILDLLAGIGLILPSLLRVQTKLTVFAAFGVIALMIAAIVFHIGRGEASLTGINFVYIGLAAFIAWGRARKAPIAVR